MIRRLLTALLLLSALFSTGLGQARVSAPGTDTVRVDSARGGAAAGDTTGIAPAGSGIDSVVTYTATDSVLFLLGTKKMFLHGSGNVTYRELGLKADEIDVDWTSSTLHAQGVADTADTTGRKMMGEPILKEGSETYDGSVITYDFRTKKGKIFLGKTRIEKGLYYGDAIKKVAPDVLYVEGGRFTTCEIDHPHYYFASPEMKVTLKDKVVARPIYFYLADVPVFALPFGVFPTERGRRSGLIMPGYGESTRGRYLTHLGYFWAMTDYTDLKLLTDIYSGGSYTVSADLRYAVRYAFSGDLSGSYGRVITGETGDPDYADDRVFNLHLGHNQEFDPTTRLVVDLTFTSSSYYQQTSYTLSDLLRQNVVSNATLTKSWEGTPNSLTLNIRRDQNLQPAPGTVELTEVLPSILFSRSLTYPFRSSRAGGTSSPQSWYDYIGYSYNGTFLNNLTRVRMDPASPLDQRYGVQHALAVTAAPKLGYLTFSQFVNYAEKWYNNHIEREMMAGDTLPTTREVPGFRAVRYFDMGVSLSTKLYGIVQPGIFGITGIRHQVLPSLTYAYQPDFSQAKFDYFGTYVDRYGQVQSYSKFEREVFGGAPAGERQSLSLNIGNVFEMKTASADSAVKENKFQLLNLNAGIGYNFAADSLRFSEIGLDFRTTVGQVLSIGGSGRFNLYRFATDPRNPQIGRRVNQFLWTSEGRLADMTQFSISIGTRLSGERKTKSSGTSGGGTTIDTLRQGGGPKTGMYGLYDQPGEPDFSIPWNLDLMWNFSESRSDPRYPSRSSGLIIGVGFNLTEFWKISGSTSYDIRTRQFSAAQLQVYRDLHCWEMSFNWVPLGPYRNFRLELRLKDPLLQDVKVSKQSSTSGIY